MVLWAFVDLQKSFVHLVYNLDSMEVTLTYKGKRISLPTTAKELTLWQYQALVACFNDSRTDYASLISAITGLPIDAILASEGNADLFPAILDGMANEIASWPTSDASKDFEVRGIKHHVKAWGLQTMGQRIAYQQATEGKDYTQAMHLVLAILVARDAFGDKWGENYMMLAQEMRYAPAYMAVPILFFFWRKRTAMSLDGEIQLSSLLTLTLKNTAAKRWPYLGFST